MSEIKNISTKLDCRVRLGNAVLGDQVLQNGKSAKFWRALFLAKATTHLQAADLIDQLQQAGVATSEHFIRVVQLVD
jgi:hypothetical protein